MIIDWKNTSMENHGLPDDLKQQLHRGVHPGEIASKLAREVEESITKMDEKVVSLAEKRKTFPALIANEIVQEKRNRLLRLSKAQVSDVILDTPINVDKLRDEINTVCATSENILEKHASLKEELEKLRLRDKELAVMESELYGRLVDSPYSPIYALPKDLPRF